MADVNRGNRPLSPHLSDLSPATDFDHLDPDTDHRQRVADRVLADRLVVVWRRPPAPEYFAFVDGIITSFFGDLVMFGSLWALWYHSLAGWRHLIWDSVMMLEIDTGRKAGLGRRSAVR